MQAPEQKLRFPVKQESRDFLKMGVCGAGAGGGGACSGRKESYS